MDHTVTASEQRADTVWHSRSFLRAALANSSDLVVVIDESATLTYVSGASDRILGRSADEWIGRNVFELLHPDDASAAAESMVTSVESGTGVKDPIELRVLHADGRWREVEVVANNLLHDPEVAGILINARDVSERHDSHRRITSANRRFEQAFVRSPIGMAITTLEGRFVRANPAMCELLGRDARELLTRSILELTHPDDIELTITAALELLEGDVPSFSLEKRFVHADGTEMWTRSSVTVLRDDDDMPLHFLTQVEDVGERRSLLEQLRRSALLDPLTGLANRAGYEEYLATLPRSSTVGVIALDLDRFKDVNDTAGHAAGDEVLAEVARRITETTRADDHAARIGGDEFVVVCLEPDLARLTGVAQRLVDEIRRPIRTDPRLVGIGASAGLAIGPASRATELLRLSDAASYEAKRSGGNSVVVASDPGRSPVPTTQRP